MLLFVTLLMAFLPLKQEYLYTTSLLADIGSEVDISIVEDPSGSVEYTGSYQGMPLAVRHDDGVISHVGVELFDKTVKAGSDRYLYEFPERYLLELMLCSDVAERERKMHNDSVRIHAGSLQSVPSLKKNGTSFSLTITSDFRYSYSWKDASESELFSFTAPAQCELILGCNKKDLEERFKHALTGGKAYEVEYQSAPSGEPVRMSEDLYIDRRGEYMIENMADALYYVRRHKKYDPVYDKDYPFETISNLFHFPDLFTDAAFNANIVLNKYGFETEQIICSLKTLVDFCLWEGCTPYVGLESLDGEKMTASVIMVNELLGYNHIFKVELAREALTKKEVNVQVTANVYVTTHNLKNLYNDKPSENKNHVKRIKVQL